MILVFRNLYIYHEIILVLLLCLQILHSKALYQFLLAQIILLVLGGGLSVILDTLDISDDYSPRNYLWHLDTIASQLVSPSKIKI